VKIVVTILAILIITGCGQRVIVPESIIMTGEYDGQGDALFMGCMAGLARRDIERGQYWTEYILRSNGKLCEEIRRDFDRGHALGLKAEQF
jgi:hypothetical protein